MQVSEKTFEAKGTAIAKVPKQECLSRGRARAQSGAKEGVSGSRKVQRVKWETQILQALQPVEGRFYSEMGYWSWGF